MSKDTSHHLGDFLQWGAEDDGRARPERAQVAFIRLASQAAAEAVAAELEAGGSFYAAAKRAQTLGVTLPGEMFAVVTRDERPEVFDAVPGTTFPPVAEGEGFVVIRLVAFDP